MQGIAFGVDVGGSGIKGAPVDLATGELAAARFKAPTPQPATPDTVAGVVGNVVAHFGWDGPVGCTFPGVVMQGVARTAANMDAAWVGTDVAGVVGAAVGAEVTAVNDADAAGLAEVLYGAARGRDGLVLVVTLGTGIGTALVYQGRLIPNLELGHIELGGVDAETRASAAAREHQGLDWARWARRLQRYFRALEDYLWPELIVVGGGVSRRADRFLPLLQLRTPIVAATLENRAGTVGAAVLSHIDAGG